MKLNAEYKNEKESEDEEIIEERKINTSGGLKLFKILFLYCLVGFIGWYLFNFLFHSEIFKIRNVIISGNDCLTDQKIFQESEINIGENIFLLGIKKSISSLRKDPWIREVSIKKIFPDKIKILVEERKPSAIVKNGNEYLQSSKNGFILCSVNYEQNTSKLPLISGLSLKNTGIGERILENEYRTALEIIHCIEVILPKVFCEVTVLDQDDFFIYNKDKSVKIRANKADEIIGKENMLRDAFTKISNEKLLVDYIDLRFKDSLVIKIKK